MLLAQAALPFAAAAARRRASSCCIPRTSRPSRGSASSGAASRWRSASARCSRSGACRRSRSRSSRSRCSPNPRSSACCRSPCCASGRGAREPGARTRLDLDGRLAAGLRRDHRRRAAHLLRVGVGRARADPSRISLVQLRTIFALAGRYVAMALTGFGVAAFQEPPPARVARSIRGGSSASRATLAIARARDRRAARAIARKRRSGSGDRRRSCPSRRSSRSSTRSPTAISTSCCPA